MNGAFAQVLGNFCPGIVGAEGFLVDVLFKDVAEHVRVDFVVFAARRIVQVPGITLEKLEQVFKSLVRDLYVLPPGFDWMRQKKTAVEVFNFSEQIARLLTALILWFSKTFEEKRIEKVPIIEV